MARYIKTGSPSTIGAIDAELDKIQVAIADTLSRKGDTPNQMEGVVDMNNEQMYNLPFPSSETGPLRKKDVNFSQSVDAGIPPTYFNVVSYGAIGDGATPCNAAFQAAFDAASQSGGIVYIPAGIYRRANTIDGVLASTWSITGDNVTVMGAGDASVIFHDDKADELRSDLLNATGDSFTLRDFKILGTARDFTITNSANYSQTLTGSTINRLRILNISVEAVHNMGMTFSRCDDVYVSGCRLVDVVRDGYRFTGGRNVRISGNYGKNIADDCVAIHSLDGFQFALNVVVDGNVFEGCQGMKFLGAKNVTVTNNIMTRGTRGAVWIASDESVEGNTNMHTIKIVDNVFSDFFSTLGSNAIIQIKGSPIVADGSGNFPAIDALPYADNYTNNIDVNGTAVMPIQRLEIRGNTIVRTLEAVSDYSDWGFGEFFDRVDAGFAIPTTSYFQTRAVVDSDFNTYGINLNAPCQTVLIEANTFDGHRLAPIRVLHTDFGTPLTYQHLLIKDNTFINTGRSTGGAIFLEDAGVTNPNSSNIEISGNYFDGDPFFNATGHNADNTWVGDSDYLAIKQFPTVFLNSLTVSKNTFKNVSGTGILVSANTRTFEPNICFLDYISSSANAGNKGIRVPPESKGNILVKIDGDPASGTYGEVVHFPERTAASTSFPLTGFWANGHFIENRAPAPVTDPSTGLYVVHGWYKAGTDSNGAIGTGSGFLELRSFIQNIT